MKIKAVVNTTKKDYIEFQKCNLYKYMWMYFTLAALVVFIGVLMIVQMNKTGYINDMLLMLFVIIILLFLYMIINSIIKITKQAKKEDCKPVFDYTFTKGGVHCESGDRSFDLPWIKVYMVKESKKMFFVYINKNSAFIVPKRCFASESDIVEFRDNFLFKPKKTEKRKKTKPLL